MRSDDKSLLTVGYPDTLIDYELTGKDLHASRVIRFKEKDYRERIVSGGYWIMYNERKIDIRNGEDSERRSVVHT